jgi:hypothetical protein
MIHPKVNIHTTVITHPKNIFFHPVQYTNIRDTIPILYITHLFYSCNLLDSGKLEWFDNYIDIDKRFIEYGDSWNDDNTFVHGNIQQLFKLKQQYRHLKVLLSPQSINNLSIDFSNKEKREILVKDSIQFILDYGFDGIEYNTSNINDFPNFTLFIQELRSLLAPQFLITIVGPISHFSKYKDLYDFINFFSVSKTDLDIVLPVDIPSYKIGHDYVENEHEHEQQEIQHLDYTTNHLQYLDSPFYNIRNSKAQFETDTVAEECQESKSFAIRCVVPPWVIPPIPSNFNELLPSRNRL